MDDVIPYICDAHGQRLFLSARVVHLYSMDHGIEFSPLIARHRRPVREALTDAILNRFAEVPRLDVLRMTEHLWSEEFDDLGRIGPLDVWKTARRLPVARGALLWHIAADIIEWSERMFSRSRLEPTVLRPFHLRQKGHCHHTSVS
jgi:hypothetical protein